MLRMAFSYGCLMVPLPQPLAEQIRAYGESIPPELLRATEDAVSGVPNDIHITVKYGLLTTNAIDVAAVMSDVEPFGVVLGRANIFHNDDENVLKLGIESPGLRELHRRVCGELEHVNTYASYRPHVTVAYLVKRDDDPYYYRRFFREDFEGVSFIADRVVFSTPDGEKTEIPIGGVAVDAKAREARIAERIAFNQQDAALTDLYGGLQFSPKFPAGKAFIVHGSGVYVRNPYGGETFRKIRMADAMIELGLAEEGDDIKAPFLYYAGSYSMLANLLVNTHRFHVKRLTDRRQT